MGANPETIVDWVSILPNEWHEDFYKMLVFDALIGNTDRHLTNWGVFIDTDTGQIKGLHPLFDYNCAIDIRDVNDFLSYEHPSMSGTSMLQAAQYSLKHLSQDFLLLIYDLIDWYYSKEAKKLFKSTYNRLDELGYLKSLAHVITSTEPRKSSILGIFKF